MIAPVQPLLSIDTQTGTINRYARRRYYGVHGATYIADAVRTLQVAPEELPELGRLDLRKALEKFRDTGIL